MDPNATPAPAADPAPSIIGGDPAPAPAPPASASPAPAPAPAAAPASGDPAPANGAPAADSTETKPFTDSLPEDWRQQLATQTAGEEGDSGKILKQLERYSSMDAVVKALMEGKETIRSGQIKADTRPEESAGPEALAAWREERGVPDTPDGYEMKAPEGVILGENDKAIFDGMREHFHNNDMSADQANGLVESWLASNEAMRTAAEQKQQQQLTDAKSALRDTWGSDYKANIGILDNLLGQMPDETRQLFEYGTLADGSPLTSNAAIVSWLVQKEREANPVATSVPTGAGTIQTVNDEIKQLESRMTTKEWFKDQPAQDRLQELYEARDNYNKKHG